MTTKRICDTEIYQVLVDGIVQYTDVMNNSIEVRCPNCGHRNQHVAGGKLGIFGLRSGHRVCNEWHVWNGVDWRKNSTLKRELRNAFGLSTAKELDERLEFLLNFDCPGYNLERREDTLDHKWPGKQIENFFLLS